MPYFAELNENNEVIAVLYLTDDQILDENGNESEQLGIDHLHFHHGADRRWVRTSYGGNFRGQYAGIGFTYDENLDIFVCPQPYPSWILNTQNGSWDPPYPPPVLTNQQILDEVEYEWDESEHQLNNNGWKIIQ